eukprot:9940135-Prorocentrum_lima.AAC.1
MSAACPPTITIVLARRHFESASPSCVQILIPGMMRQSLVFKVVTWFRQRTFSVRRGSGRTTRQFSGFVLLLDNHGSLL